MFGKFSNFFTFILGSPFLLPLRANNGKGKFSQLPINMRLRGFKLGHLQPVEPILFWKIFNFFHFILGSPFLLPQRANYEKGEFSQLPIWMRLWGFSAWGIQTGPFAAH